MKHIVKTEAEWLALRKKYITASEAAVLVGADPYSSPAKLRNPSPFSGNAFTFVGQMLEPIVCNVTNAVLGTRFALYENAEGHKEFYTCGLLGATPDAHEDRKILLECKTTRPKTYLKYSGVPPSKYIIQNIVQQMCVDDLEDYGYLSIMSTDLTQSSAKLKWPITIFKIWKDDRICTILEEQAQRYTDNVKFRVDSKVKQKMKLLLTMCYQEIV
jgi:predicted phage-related endonuclease